MKNIFPWIAFAIGLIISFSLMLLNPLAPDSSHKMPLLTALLLSEFGFLVNTIAAGMIIYNWFSNGIKKAHLLVLPANIIFAVYLVLMGLKLWPGIAGN